MSARRGRVIDRSLSMGCVHMLIALLSVANAFEGLESVADLW